MMRKILAVMIALAASIAWGGCGLEFVPVEPRTESGQETGSGFRTYQSLHFSVQSNDMDLNLKVASAAEEIYKKVMFDTNLLSFKPRENYRITIYRDQNEYQQRTGLPAWSAGGATTKPLWQILPSERELKSRTSVVTYETVLTNPLLAHELTHLIFNEFMAFETYEEMSAVRWLNEGLATFEEMGFFEDGFGRDLSSVTRGLVKSHAMPISEAVRFRPLQVLPQAMGRYHVSGQTLEYSDIDLWYWQVRFLTEFLIQREGQYNFYLFLNALKQKKDFPSALEAAYPGKWRTLGELEIEWLQWL